MWNKVLLFAAIVCCPFVARSQSDSTLSQLSYFITLQAGGLMGEQEQTALTASVTQGVRLKRVALGVGIGYDDYTDWRALPIFVSGSYDVVKRGDRAWFLQFNTGYATARPSMQGEEQVIVSNASGYFFHPLIGYRLSSGKKALSFSAGYKFQSLNYEQTPRWWIWGRPGSSRLLIDRDIQRLSFQIGIGIL